MKFSRLTWSLAATFLCYGAVVFSFGPCLTSMSDTFQVPVGRLGLIFTVYAVGLIPSVLLNGYLSEVMGRRLILLGIVLIMGIGCALFGLAAVYGGRNSLILAMAAMVLLGYGGGGIETLTNIVIADDNQPAPAMALNITHAFFAVGAVLSPLGVSLLLRSHLPWQYIFYGNGALFATQFALLFPQRMPSATQEPFPPGAALRLLRLPLVWVLLAMITLYVGAEMGVSAWVSPLMEKVLQTPRNVAGLSVSVFWALMIVGRLAVSPLSMRFRPPPLLFVLALGSAAGAIGIAASTSATWCLVMTGVSGLFMSGVFALVLIDASRHFPERLGAVFGIIMVGVGVGSLLIPAAMGALSDAFGLRAAMLVPAGLMAIVAASYLARWSQ
jgi:fucose permease